MVLLKRRIVFIFFSFVFLYLDARNFFTPLPYGYGMPYGKSFCNFAIPAKSIDPKDNWYSITPSVTLYSRSANQSFSRDSFNSKHDLSYIFHGSDSFKFGEIFKDNTVPSDFQQYQLIGDVSVKPAYKYYEDGCIVGVGLYKNVKFENRNWNVRMNINLPIKKLSVQNHKNYDSLDVENILVPDKTVDSWFSTRMENIGGKQVKTFALRLDRLYKDGFISLYPESVYDENTYTINNSIIVKKAGVDRVNGGLNLDSITAGKAWYQDGGVKKVDRVTSRSSNTTVVIGGKTFTTVLKTSDLGDGKAIIPVCLYQEYSSPSQLFLSNGKCLAPRPNVIGALTVNTNYGLFFTDNRDGEIADNVNVLGPIDNKIELKIVGIPNREGDSNIYGVTYPAPPIAIKKLDDPYGYEGSFYSKLSLPEHKPESDNKYKDSIDIFNDAEISVVKDDGSLNGNSSEKVVLHPTVNYENLFTRGGNDDNASKLYVMTSIDSNGNVTPESEYLLKNIEGVTVDRENDETMDTLYNVRRVLQGYYRDGTTSLNEKMPANEFQNAWTKCDARGIGDLDFELSFGTTWHDGTVLGDLVFGFIAPTSASANVDGSYLSMPLGNNGHYEGRLGVQLSCDVNKWIRIAGYCHGAMAMSSVEKIIAPFKNATYFGLQPSTVYADVSWQSLIASADLSLFATEWSSMSLKYQYMFKTKDSIELQKSRALDASGIYREIASDQMKAYSERQSHKLMLTVSTAVGANTLLSFGASTLVGGKNIGIESDVFLTAIMEF